MGRRSYGQFEGLARALDVVGERWTLLLIRDLLLGPQRYKDLLEGLHGIGTNLLAARLRDLEQQGLVRRRTLPPPAGSTVYELTERGRGLGPAILSLARWGLESMSHPRENEVLRPGWGVLAARATFRPEAARGVRETYEFHIGDDVFHIAVEDGAMQARQGPAARADLVVSTDVETFMAIGARQLGPMEAVATGRAQVEGSPEVALRCVEILGLPTPDVSEMAPGQPVPGRAALSMRAVFQPQAALGVHDTYEFHVDDEVFHLTVDDGELETRIGPAARPDFVFSTDLRTFLAIGAGQVGVMEAISGGRAEMEGDTEAAMRCMKMFALPGPTD
jgi:DNA-binding HxlR family transcriptional regulator/putative sterol carrier protein